MSEKLNGILLDEYMKLAVAMSNFEYNLTKERPAMMPFYEVLDKAKADFPEKPDPDVRPDPQTKRIWDWYSKWFGRP